MQPSEISHDWENFLKLHKLILAWGAWCGLTVGSSRAQDTQLDLTELPAEVVMKIPDRLAMLQSKNKPASEVKGAMQREFFAGASQTPRLPLVARSRLAVERYGRPRRVYLKIKELDGRITVGELSYSSEDGFEISTSWWKSRQIKYAALESVPEPVAAPGQKLLRVLEITGVVAVVIIVSPIVIPVLAVACLFGRCVD
jgi:hypothetical protein